MKREFCLNSRRWIEKMVINGRPPLSCPLRNDNFLQCQNCGYYQMKEETKYLKRFHQNQLKIFFDEINGE